MAEAEGCGRADGVWPLIVVGAGAAGLLAAIFAARAGARTLLLETRREPGAKIRASGGGRCNVLPAAVSPADFHTDGSPHALRNVLASWPLAQAREFFERDLGVPLKQEETGKLFPVDDDPRRIVRALLAAADRAGATLWGEARVTEARRVDAAGADDAGGAPLAGAGDAGGAPVAGGAGGARFALLTAAGNRLLCRRLILATGGRSLPKTGSDGHGYWLAASLGHSLVPPYPALVPLVGGDAAWHDLAGLSVPAAVTATLDGRARETREGSLLFTHRGWSGPVILDMSWHVTRPGAAGTRLTVRWGGAAAPDWEAWLRGGADAATGRRTIGAALADHLPRRLALRLLALAGVPPEARLAELGREARQALAAALAACPLPVTGDEGFRVAEVTGGGVPLGEVSPRTLESRPAPGLHLAGEILDVTGRVGGFNFLWAWVTGRLAGQAAAAALRDG